MGQPFNMVYSLLVEMCGPNETAMRQVFDHALVDADQYPSTLWSTVHAAALSQNSPASIFSK